MPIGIHQRTCRQCHGNRDLAGTVGPRVSNVVGRHLDPGVHSSLGVWLGEALGHEADFMAFVSPFSAWV